MHSRIGIMTRILS